jgi:RHS repeat-associated protein
LYGWDGDNLAWESRAPQQEGEAGRTIHYVFKPGTFIPVAQAMTNHSINLMGLPDYDENYSLEDDPLWNRSVVSPPIDVLTWYQCDHLGTPLELTDQNGDVVWSAQYKAWGEIREDLSHWGKQKGIANPVRFQGQYHDHETGLHYNRYRYYDPMVGRFISQDPISYAGGLNLYFYGDNPVVLIDPLGLAGHKVGANTAGQDVLARGVHVNVNGAGLPPAGGHIALKPNAEGTHVVLEPADKATRAMPNSQWGKACECVSRYLDKPSNVDRLTKAAQAGVDANPNSARVSELKQIGSILGGHHAAGTNPLGRK